MSRIDGMRTLAEAGEKLGTSRLRDEFAGKAMQSLLRGSEGFESSNLPNMAKIIAKDAYVIADAMILERGVV